MRLKTYNAIVIVLEIRYAYTRVHHLCVTKQYYTVEYLCAST